MVKLTFATTCMGRKEHLVQTLPTNLTTNRYPNVEFLVLDYNSPDGLEDWIRQNYKCRLDHGLNFYREKTQPYFQMAHAKNLAANLAEGDIVVNVDADQFIDADLGYHVVEALSDTRSIACPPPPRRGAAPDTCGLIACHKANLMLLGGYDEQMIYGWGVEDKDLVTRASMLGFAVKHIQPCKQFLSHPRADRNANTSHRLAAKDSAGLHQQIHKRAMEAGKYVANVGTKAGAAIVICNFSTVRESGFFPVTLHETPRDNPTTA